MSYQKVIIMGNIGKIEQRFTASGDSIVNFSVAVNDNYTKKSGEKVEDVEWFRCVSFGKQSEVISQYFNKGSRIMVEGTLKTRQWDDESGATRYNTDLRVSNFSFIDKKSDSQPAQQPAQHNNSAPQQQNTSAGAPQTGGGYATSQAPQMPNVDEFDDDIGF